MCTSKMNILDFMDPLNHQLGLYLENTHLRCILAYNNNLMHFIVYTNILNILRKSKPLI